MKVCSKNRKSIALLAIGALESQPARELRGHIERCAGCRNYLAEISGVTAALGAGEPDSDVHTSERFHQRTVAALNAAEGRTAVSAFGLHIRSLLNWRIALPVAAMAAVMIALMSTNSRDSRNASRSPQRDRPQLTLATHANLAPTAGNYEMVANQSLEKLDELITRQGNQNASPTPVYTASMLPGSALSE